MVTVFVNVNKEACICIDIIVRTLYKYVDKFLATNISGIKIFLSFF